MNKLYFILLPIIFILGGAGCDNVNVLDNNLVYKEYIVVRAELKANMEFEGVAFTKTLPTNQQYDTAAAELKDITAFLKVNGVKIMPLIYQGNGIYNTLNRLIIQPGYTYELLAEYNNSSIYAITKVPSQPRVVYTSIVNNSYIDAAVKRREGEAYGSIWEIYNPATSNITDRAEDFATIISASQDTLTDALTQTANFPAGININDYLNNLYVKVFAFDSAYAEYFKTRNNNQPISNTFAQGGDLIAWNVHGENTIGLFIGVYEGGEVKVSTNIGGNN